MCSVYDTKKVYYPTRYSVAQRLIDARVISINYSLHAIGDYPNEKKEVIVVDSRPRGQQRMQQSSESFLRPCGQQSSGCSISIIVYLLKLGSTKLKLHAFC